MKQKYSNPVHFVMHNKTQQEEKEFVKLMGTLSPSHLISLPIIISATT